MCDTERVKEKEIDRDDKNFPEKLKSELVRPIVKKLWYRGKWNSKLFEKCAAVVGARKMSRYGKQALGEIIPKLCGAGYTIVSGLMYGVDQEAHKLTLECGGCAIAVLGYGINARMEEEAARLAGKIVERGGLILSEYSDITSARIWTFPQRNRIVVGISDVIVVAEAGEKSGSLNTASWARRMNKPVYAIPGSVFSPTSEGTNWLVAQGLAKALTVTELNALTHDSSANTQQKNSLEQMEERERELITKLKVEGPMGVNEIARKSNLSAGEILGRLLQLEIKGWVVEERGMWKAV